MSDATISPEPAGRSPEDLFANVPGFVRDEIFSDLEKGRIFRALFGEPVAQSKISRFRLLEHVGSGGMARVFAAYDEQLDRKVAIKVVRPRDVASKLSNQRLLREAQTLAQLSHPNIVQVYEAGLHGDTVFIAMEFVRGRTLSDWLVTTRALPRRQRWRQILDLFIDAGRGLDAAHQAGLVHRDFKPDNVLVGDDGRVRVVDFGMARAVSQPPRAVSTTTRHDDSRAPTVPGVEASDDATAPTLQRDVDAHQPDAGSAPAPRAETHSPAVAASEPGKAALRLTVTGTIMGTPRFMSPEQLAGHDVDHRSDQFSFCVSLFHALYGEWPFEAADLATRLEVINRGELATPRGQSEVPASVRRAILRGLKANPDGRFPDMSALLRALDDWRLRGRRVALVVAVVALMGAGVSTFAAVTGQPAICAGVSQELDAMWTVERQRSIAAAFERSGVAYADTAWDNTQRLLDDYVQRWRATATATCENPMRRDSTVHRLCLDGGMQRFAALLTSLENSTDETLDKAVEAAVAAASALPEPGECGDADILSLGMEPPPLAQADDVRALRERLNSARTQELLGDYRSAQAQVERLRVEVVGVPYAPVHAELLHQLGRVLATVGGAERVERAQQAYFDALDIAEGARHDRLAVDIWHDLVTLAEQHHSDMAQGYAWSRRQRAAVRRVGDDPVNRAFAHHALGRLHKRSGDYAAAEAELRRAIETHRGANPDALSIGHYYHDLATTLRRRGDYPEAWRLFDTALAMQTAHYGADHPQVARLQMDFAQMLTEHEDIARARSLLHSALVTWEQALGVNSRQVARIHVNLAEIEATAGDFAAARTHASQALAIFRKLAPPGHHLYAEAYMVVGITERYARRWDAALEAFETALEIRRQHFKPTQQEPMWAAIYVSDVLGQMGRFEQALTHCESLRDISKTTATPPSLRAMLLTACGRAYRGLEQRTAALASLEEAVRLFQGFEGLSWERATAYGALARTLRTTDEPPGQRVCALASEARALFEASGQSGTPMRDELDDLHLQCSARP
jgi:serine/threonine protein kinase/tetratricopeptide (TPR) repeat protein